MPIQISDELKSNKVMDIGKTTQIVAIREHQVRCKIAVNHKLFDDLTITLVLRSY